MRRAAITSWNEVSGLPKYCDYILSGKETCPETGRLHWHIYAEFSRSLSMADIKRLWGDKTLHIMAVAKREAYEGYCRKYNDCVELGVPKRQGERTDLHTVASELENGSSVGDIARDYPVQYVRYCRGLESYKSQLLCERFSKTLRDIRTYVIIGEAGTGKTSYVFEKHPIEDIYKWTPDGSSTAWFDGYWEQPVLLIDDFRGHLLFSFLLNLLDRYPVRLPVKGGFRWAGWTTVYITSNVDIPQWYRCDLKPLHRRITGKMHFINENAEVACNTDGNFFDHEDTLSFDEDPITERCEF